MNDFIQRFRDDPENDMIVHEIEEMNKRLVETECPFGVCCGTSDICPCDKSRIAEELLDHHIKSTLRRIHA